MKGWIGTYATIIFIIIVVMRFVDGKTGIFLLSFFVLFLLFSFLASMAARKNVQVTVEKINSVYKNSDFTIRIFFSCKAPSLATVYLKPHATQNLLLTNGNPMGKILTKSQKTTIFEYDCTAEICGNGKVTFFYFITDILKTPFFAKEQKIEVNIPVAFEIFNDGNFFDPLIKVCDEFQDEPDENSAEISNFRAQSFPGYEHRKYIIGDSLKKINWKLSARLDELMTRLDENTNGINLIFIVDISQSYSGKLVNFDEAKEFEKQTFLSNERLFGYMFKLMEESQKSGFSVKLSINNLYFFDIFSENDIRSATVELACHRPEMYKNANSILPTETNKYTANFLFSNYIDKKKAAEISSAIQSGKLIQTFSCRENTERINNFWLINANNNLTKA